jgi:hypothetical protein
MYSVILDHYDETHVVLTDTPQAIEETSFQLTDGIPLAEEWPADVRFRFSKNRKDGLTLTDYIDNSFQWLIISPRFRTLLEDLEPQGIEFLPIEIRNHKGRLAADDYCLANLFPLVEAVDRPRSVFKLDSLSPPDGIFTFEKLALLQQVEAGDRVVFRLKEQPMLILVRDDVAHRVEELGFTGMRFVPTAQFRTFE